MGSGLMLSAPTWAGEPASPGKSSAPPATRSYLMPLSFEENQGQVDPQVKYLARGQGYTLFLTPGAEVLGLRNAGERNSTAWLRLSLKDAAGPAIQAEEKLPGTSNYFVGSDPTLWRTQIPTFGRVRYQHVYPGVDLIYYGRQGQLENDFELAPGTDPKVITWLLEGATSAKVEASGDLVLTVGDSEVRLRRPRAYQNVNGVRQEVPVGYRVRGGKITFALGKYRRDQRLVIDPVLIYSTYLGGSGGDAAFGVTLNSANGNVYVTGETASINFPTSPVDQNYVPNTGETDILGLIGQGNVFVTEFNSTGTGIVFSTYLGGSGLDIPSQIYLASNGNLFIVGSTTSNNYPTTSGVFQPSYAGNQDAFLTEMKPDGSALVYSTYVGGTQIDYGTAVAIDSSGNAYVTGATNSVDFPTLNPIQLSNDGLYDAYVTEISPTGALIYSTYLGGSLSDYGTGIAVGSGGSIYVAGYTFSSNFPTQSAFQSTLSGGSDLFVSKFVPGATSLQFSTYLGGSSIDQANGMTLDASDNVYLTGETQSSNFPVTVNAYQSQLLGTENAFVAELSSDGSTLTYSTYIGGSATDQANAIAVDPAGNMYITGYTQSNNFPQLDSFQTVLGTGGAGTCVSTNLINVPSNTLCSDAFAAKFSSSGTPVYSSFLGGSGNDTGQAIVVDSLGDAYVAGATYSPNFPTTAGAFQWTYQGSDTFSNAFLTEIGSQDAPSVSLNPQQINFGNEPLELASSPVIVTLTNEGSTALSISSVTVNGDFQVTNNCGVSVSGGGGTCTLQIVFDPTTIGVQTDLVEITDNAGPSGASATQSIDVTGTGVLSGGSLTFSPAKLTFGAQTVGTTSPNQTAVLVNNGYQPVTITSISATGGFAQTNNCGTNLPTVPATLNAGQTCTVTVSFSPTSTGSVTGGIVVASSAVKAPSVQLSGTGTPIFSLSTNARSSVLVIGTTSTTFSISAAGPSTFTNPITLSCAGGATCGFNPSSISPGGSSTLTISGLSATTANPLNVVVTGTGGGQSASVALSIFFADFSISAVPSGTTVSAGSQAIYTITVTPTNGFNQTVLLNCPTAYPGIPLGAICYWTPPALTLTGTNAQLQSTLTITTTTESTRLLRPPGNFPAGPGRWILMMALLVFLAAVVLGFRRSGVWLRPRLRLAVLLFAMLLISLAAGCENYVNPISISPYVNGTPAGTYNIVLVGTLGNGSNVQRTTTISLSVLP